MKYNALGPSDLKVSEIGFGCMSLGTDESQAVRLIHEAMNQGINFFDTADLYDHGRNEELLGKAIKGKRSDIILATKVGNRRVPGQEGWVWDPSKAYIKEAVKESLKRLGTDYIDLYQLHGGTLEDPIDETIEAFEELKREGWIRYYGISSIRPNVVREYVARANIVSVMSQYSILDRRPEEEIIPVLAEQGISLIARGPVAKGILSEHSASKIEEGFLDYTKEELTELIGQLSKLVTEERSLSQLALRYALQSETVATVIPGASRMEQLLQNIQAGQLPDLTAEEMEWILKHSKANRYTQHR
ncbi:aldo/keto reductase [Marinicrinis lubricantis]|uniref:Aldo/keto reductase n=1 Tax=Marinicrinis lubricantis TaxID=2086470 RepID=A0ABW1IRD8_9BACL